MACQGCRKAKKKFSTNMKKVIASNVAKTSEKELEIQKPETKSRRQIRAEIRAKRKARRENRRLRQLKKLEKQNQQNLSANIHKNQV